MKKKLFLFLIVLTFTINLSGCFYVVFDKYYEIIQNNDQVTSIALYQTDHTSYDNALLEPELARIDKEQFDAFITELEEIPFVNGMFIVIAAVDPNFSFSKYVIVIDYANGDREMISEGYQEIHYESGKIDDRMYEIDEDPWYEFLQKYFGSDITKGN